MTAHGYPTPRVLETVTTADGTDTTQRETSLGVPVDPALLDRLLDSADSEGTTGCTRASFTNRGHDVTVTADGGLALA